MKTKKLGFTLIELLVVIVILVIVALITTPIVLDIIENATDKANRSSAYGIMETAKLYRIEEMFKDKIVPTTNLLSLLKVKGSKPQNGDVRVNSSGYIAIALQYGNKCYKKGFEEEDIKVVDNIEECKINDSEETPPLPDFNVAKQVNRPQLTEGMTPIKWDASNNEVITNEEDSEWYDYSAKKWANAKTTDGSYFVWIPRYAYKMNDGYHSNIASSFDIKFLKGNTNEPTDSTIIETEGYNADTKNTLNNYFLHPAFQNDMNEYGFWVAKFEPSGSEDNIKIIPNESSLRSMTIGAQFSAAKGMKDNSVYGWNASKVDTHMMTNLEWGAGTYLTHSTYGKNAEVWINPNSNYIVGCAGTSVNATSTTACNTYSTSNGMQASTTGNITGIYDMSGGALEYVSAYVNNGHSYLTTYGSSLINETDLKYKNIYTKGSTDNNSMNYNTNKNIYGDAVWETSSTGENSTSWNGDCSWMSNVAYPFFWRGGLYQDGAAAGLFYFGSNDGSATLYASFRPVVSIK